jgi:hypothetical protein
MAASPVFPRVRAMVVCDGLVPTDEEGVYNLAGVRTRIWASNFPYIHPLLCVYVQATGHQGAAPCSLTLLQAETDSALFTTPGRQVEFAGPLDVVCFTWRIRRCRFPRPGLYYFQVHFGTRLANERLFTLLEGAVGGNGQEI